jgi:hypothetical protein
VGESARERRLYPEIMFRTLKFLFTFIPKRSIANPRLGIFDLTAGASDALIESDKAAFASIFATIVESKVRPPLCDVLFLYATLEPGGSLSGTENFFRATIRDCGAKIVVLASNNPRPPASQYRPPYGHANIVITLERNGGSFANFFSQLFWKMKEGTTMPRAWTMLAPQLSGRPHIDCPSTIFLCELGGLRFARKPERCKRPLGL